MTPGWTGRFQHMALYWYVGRTEMETDPDEETVVPDPRYVVSLLFSCTV